jgi:hypothetical protein
MEALKKLRAKTTMYPADNCDKLVSSMGPMPHIHR